MLLLHRLRVEASYPTVSVAYYRDRPRGRRKGCRSLQYSMMYRMYRMLEPRGTHTVPYVAAIKQHAHATAVNMTISYIRIQLAESSKLAVCDFHTLPRLAIGDLLSKARI